MVGETVPDSMSNAYNVVTVETLKRFHTFDKLHFAALNEKSFIAVVEDNTTYVQNVCKRTGTYKFYGGWPGTSETYNAFILRPFTALRMINTYYSYVNPGFILYNVNNEVQIAFRLSDKYNGIDCSYCPVIAYRYSTNGAFEDTNSDDNKPIGNLCSSNWKYIYDNTYGYATNGDVIGLFD